ncbi:hypothetical protein RHGRI_001306 [Rhododendron griersonianum]|uniref:Ubiquitin-like protease family profile domain-containing protein n=1 Tax=Rhododendron griersonianum TaxID=479676 RepID=A0AAV6LJQ3_9ERIC|nr:hypothetical protein RHGRI_001306 [Rhododendron griersonianum]
MQRCSAYLMTFSHRDDLERMPTWIPEHSSVAAEVWKNMSVAERSPFLELANEVKARNNKNVPKKKKTPTLPVFRSRCSPKALVKQNGKLNMDQIEAIGRLGFGSMLTLQCQILKRSFISKLVHHFNPTNKTLAFGRMKVYSITTEDVARALGLPLGTVPVPTKCEECHFEHIRAMFAETDEELKRGVTFGMMREVFKSGVGDAKFQTSYVLFVLSALLCPTTKDVASTKFYPSVYDLNKISSYAWPQFVFDWLVKEVMKFKNRDVMDVDKKKDAPGVSGCVLLLMLIYFDKEEMGMNVGRDGVPLIQSWTTKLIMERIAKEENLDLVDPISTQFPEPRLLHPDAQKAFHLLKKSFGDQLQNIIIMDAALMATASQTTQENQSRGNDVREMDSPLDDDASPEFPSSSNYVCTRKKARKGVAIDDMHEERTSGFQIVHNTRDMPFYTPEHTMDDVVDTSVMEKCGSPTGVTIDQDKQNMEADVQVEEGVIVGNEGRVDVEGEEVQVQQTNEGVVEERTLTRPSKKRGNRTVKASKATRTPYVAEPEVKDAKFTKEESKLIEYVMKPYRKKEDMLGLVSMDGMTFKPSRTDLRNVFKERGRMSNLLFLPILLATCDHWFCVVINLVDKRIDVLDSMKLKSTEKTSATADVVSALFSILKRTTQMEYPWNKWNVHHPDVPQQKNMFMEHWTGGKMNTRELEISVCVSSKSSFECVAYSTATASDCSESAVPLAAAIFQQKTAVHQWCSVTVRSPKLLQLLLPFRALSSFGVIAVSGCLLCLLSSSAAVQFCCCPVLKLPVVMLNRAP